MTGRQIIAAVAVGLTVVGLLVLFVLPAWFFEPLGVCTGRACGYQFWSGIAGSFLIGGGLWSGALGMYWHHSCHVGTCIWPGRHPVEGTPYRTCKKHHPTVPSKVTATHIADAHAANQRKMEGRTK